MRLPTGPLIRLGPELVPDEAADEHFAAADRRFGTIDQQLADLQHQLGRRRLRRPTT